MERNATKLTALLAVWGMVARRSISLATGGLVATTYPVSTTMAICRVNVGQIPEAVAECIHDRLRRGTVGQRGDGDEDDTCQREDIRVRKPLLRPTGQRLGDARQPLLRASILRWQMSFGQPSSLSR